MAFARARSWRRHGPQSNDRFRLSQRSDPFQFRNISNFQNALCQRQDPSLAKLGKYAIDVDRGQSHGIGNMLLAKWTRISVIGDDPLGGDSLHQAQKQVRDARVGRTLSQGNQEQVGITTVLRQRIEDGKHDLLIRETPSADFGPCQAAHLNVRQRLRREAGLIRDQSPRKNKIAGQQEPQYLPASVRQLIVAKGPTFAKDRDILS